MLAGSFNGRTPLHWQQPVLRPTVAVTAQFNDSGGALPTIKHIDLDAWWVSRVKFEGKEG
jgi:hypothetical protein